MQLAIDRRENHQEDQVDMMAIISCSGIICQAPPKGEEVVTRRSIVTCALAAVLAATTPGTAIAQASGWITQTTDLYPSPSPDGSHLAFHSNRLGPPMLFVVDRDGGRPRPLTGAPGQITPAWSPDGRRIAFAADVRGELDIFVMNSDGTNVIQLTSNPGADMHPAWNADGTRIFFNAETRRPDGARSNGIYSVSPDGGPVLLHFVCPSECTYPAPAPDGRHIAFRREIPHPGIDWDLTESRTDSEIMVTDLRGEHEIDVSNDHGFDGWPAWSPNGRWIVFASSRAGPARVGQIYAVRPDGSGLRQLTSGDWSHAQPRFAPDGRSLFVYRLQEGTDFQFGFIAEISLPQDMR